ncbi:MAG: hypothetical protein LYZ66_05330 [Nitrososphaerales archaeon]|nr:hypothetical protein [Nitrososphaerales archaeon]
MNVFLLIFGLDVPLAPLQSGIPQMASSVIGKTWSELVSSNPWLVDYTGIIVRQQGIYLLGLNIFGIVISLKGYRRGEKWAWYTLWYYPVLFVSGALLFPSTATFLIPIIIIYLLGLLLPIRKFFPKTKNHGDG